MVMVSRRPTRGRIAHSTAQGMSDARQLELIVSRAVGGVPIPEDREMLLAIARRLPRDLHERLRPVFEALGEMI